MSSNPKSSLPSVEDGKPSTGTSSPVSLSLPLPVPTDSSEGVMPSAAPMTSPPATATSLLIPPDGRRGSGAGTALETRYPPPTSPRRSSLSSCRDLEPDSKQEGLNRRRRLVNIQLDGDMTGAEPHPTSPPVLQSPPYGVYYNAAGQPFTFGPHGGLSPNAHPPQPLRLPLVQYTPLMPALTNSAEDATAVSPPFTTLTAAGGVSRFPDDVEDTSGGTAQQLSPGVQTRSSHKMFSVAEFEPEDEEMEEEGEEEEYWEEEEVEEEEEEEVEEIESPIYTTSNQSRGMGMNLPVMVPGDRNRYSIERGPLAGYHASSNSKSISPAGGVDSPVLNGSTSGQRLMDTIRSAAGGEGDGDLVSERTEDTATSTKKENAHEAASQRMDEVLRKTALFKGVRLRWMLFFLVVLVTLLVVIFFFQFLHFTNETILSTGRHNVFEKASNVLGNTELLVMDIITFFINIQRFSTNPFVLTEVCTRISDAPLGFALYNASSYELVSQWWCPGKEDDPQFHITVPAMSTASSAVQIVDHSDSSILAFIKPFFVDTTPTVIIEMGPNGLPLGDSSYSGDSLFGDDGAYYMTPMTYDDSVDNMTETPLLYDSPTGRETATLSPPDIGYRELVSPDTTLASDNAVIYAVLLDKNRIGRMLLSNFDPQYSAATLTETYEAFISRSWNSSFLDVMLHTLTRSYPTYSTHGNSTVSVEMFDVYETTCEKSEYVWHTVLHVASNYSLFATHNPIVEPRLQYGAALGLLSSVTLCSVICIDEEISSDGWVEKHGATCAKGDPTNLYFVVQMEEFGQRYGVIIILVIGVVSIAVFSGVILVVYLSVVVPVGFMRHQLFRTVGAQKALPQWKKNVYKCTYPFWIGDISSLTSSLHVLGISFNLNKKYVPDHILRKHAKDMDAMCRKFRALDLFDPFVNAGFEEDDDQLEDLTEIANLNLDGAQHPPEEYGSGAVPSSSGARLKDGDEPVGLGDSLRRGFSQTVMSQGNGTGGMAESIFSDPGKPPGTPSRPSSIAADRLNVNASPLGTPNSQGENVAQSPFNTSFDSRKPNHSAAGPAPSDHPSGQLNTSIALNNTSLRRTAEEAAENFGTGQPQQNQSMVGNNGTSRPMRSTPSISASAPLGGDGQMMIKRAEDATILVVKLESIDTVYLMNYSVAVRQHRRIMRYLLARIRHWGGAVFHRSGDCLAAAWNAFDTCPGHVGRAAACGMEIVEAFAAYRSVGLLVGVVVHAGMFVCGIIEDAKEAFSTAFGAAAKEAIQFADLVASQNTFGLIVSEPVKQATAGLYDSIIVDVVKHDSDMHPIILFELSYRRYPPPVAEGATNAALQVRQQFTIQYAKAFAHFVQHEFVDCMRLLERVREIAPAEARRHLTRVEMLCVYFETHPNDVPPLPYYRRTPVWQNYEKQALRELQYSQSHQESNSPALSAAFISTTPPKISLSEPARSVSPRRRLASSISKQGKSSLTMQTVSDEGDRSKTRRKRVVGGSRVKKSKTIQSSQSSMVAVQDVIISVEGKTHLPDAAHVDLVIPPPAIPPHHLDPLSKLDFPTMSMLSNSSSSGRDLGLLPDASGTTDAADDEVGILDFRRDLQDNIRRAGRHSAPPAADMTLESDVTAEGPPRAKSSNPEPLHNANTSVTPSAGPSPVVASPLPPAVTCSTPVDERDHSTEGTKAGGTTTSPLDKEGSGNNGSSKDLPSVPAIPTKNSFSSVENVGGTSGTTAKVLGLTQTTLSGDPTNAGAPASIITAPRESNGLKSSPSISSHADSSNGGGPRSVPTSLHSPDHTAITQCAVSPFEIALLHREAAEKHVDPSMLQPESNYRAFTDETIPSASSRRPQSPPPTSSSTHSNNELPNSNPNTSLMDPKTTVGQQPSAGNPSIDNSSGEDLFAIGINSPRSPMDAQKAVTCSIIQSIGLTLPNPEVRSGGLSRTPGGLSAESGRTSNGVPPASSLPSQILAKNGILYQRSERVLGSGSFGSVYLGMDVRSGKLVAIKVLPLPTKETEGSNVEAEALIMCVKDPHVVEFISYAFQDHSIVIIMECMLAGSLQNMLVSFQKLPPCTAKAFIRDVLRGLNKLHSMGVIHRDVKPQNVLLTPGGNCKITDFGASAELAKQAHGNTIHGTPVYLSPEAARGAPVKVSDIWSCGIMYIQLVTGALPYPREKLQLPAEVLVFQIGAGIATPVIPDTLDELEMDFVTACLEKDVEKRRSASRLLQSPMFAV